jgi:signal transduction histidine kinase
MSLATRLSLFFLAALALVLGAFSVSLYALARSHLLHQLDERSGAALDTLTAATDIEPGGLEWDPSERLLALGGKDGAPLLWGVFDEQGQPVDVPPGAASLLGGQAERRGTGDQAAADVSWQGAPWRLTSRTLRAPAGSADAPQDGEPGKRRYRTLVLVVGVPLDPVLETLHTLAAVLTGLSLATWLAAALAGRWLSRRALVPVAKMAQAARAITPDDLGSRLPGPGTGDELADLGRAFNDLLDRLHDSFERQRRFTGEASHQLRTPLTAMLGQVEVALRRERSPEEYRRVLGLLQKQAGHLRQIVEMLLFLARADAEAKLPELEPLDLPCWLADHLQSWQGHPRHGDLRAEVDAAGPLGVRTHPGLLGQAVDNLLDNACKYSPAGSPILVRVARQGDEVQLAVEDQGQGIAADELPHVFEPFFRSPEARRRGIGGVGLGLAVTARIVAALGGHISAASRPGEGSTFVIRLRSPAEDRLPAGDPSASTPRCDSPAAR